MTEEIVEKLRTTAIDVIESSARKHELEKAPGLPAILYRWKEWSSKENVDSFIESNFLRDSHSAVSFASKFTHKVQSIGGGERIPVVKNHIWLKSIAEFVDLHRLAQIVRTSVDSGLNPEELEAKQLFLRAMDQLDSGKSIDSIDNPLG